MIEISQFLGRTPSAASASPSYWDLPGPRPLPILGNLHQLDKAAMHLSLEKLAGQYGTMFRLRLRGARFLVVADAAVISEVLRARPEAVSRAPWMSTILREMGLNGVFVAEGAQWKVQRMLITRAFTPEIVRQFVPQMLPIVERLLQRWQRALAQGAAPDIARDLRAMTLDVTVAMAMAEPINSLESEEEPLQSDIHHVFEALGRRMAAAVPYWRYFKLARDRSAEAAVARVRARLGEIIDRTRQNRSLAISAGSKPTNLLEAMVAATAEPDSGFTDEMLIGNALTMVFAGEDTTASTLAWTLVLLAANPTAAKRLAEEADRVLEGGSTLSAEQIDRLDYTEAVLHESMRIKPTAPMLPVCANHEQRVGPVLVPAGTRLLLLTRLAWQTSGQFSAPEVFDPDRWFTHGGLTSASDPNRKMVPFGGGPRLCPGRYLAIVEMKAVLCLLAARFEFVAGDRPVDRPLDRPPDRPLEHPLDRPPNQPVAAERLAFTMKPDRVDLALRLRGRGPSAVS